ncbi:Mlp family lipoprotein (plasmid) [Borrelia miyamotoi]|uniref:Mlp family lipoprotein n=2 Tax=Borrelia miyamotoi TaxID=47466 RepID=A0AAQ3CLT4_9SPIR|nr:Mlp family lipoprotein [Borrelia miyamotoi]AHH05740.1 Mlp lipoprotein family protein [Borrelia miyamotoi FR64b]ATQ15354.1 Mlp family lipoprotein [Borrelia miyamotoi]ATQ16538.1 Mlp family lipoprotein [Borrelia miyamotoi]ATQ17684.1 Mlp family lipoprotein [Borrelia miyamotoi]ATQ18864.1 Mlp family lipoprotein [Borrelia miyamotoi]
MIFFINYVILLSELLFYCCEGHSNFLEKKTSGKTKKEMVILTDYEQKKLDSLIKPFIQTLNKKIDQVIECKNRQVKCKIDFLTFSNWLSKDIKKQKELVNDFTIVYDFLEVKRKKHATNMTFDQYISNAIDNVHDKYGNHIYNFFRDSLNNILRENRDKGILLDRILNDVFRKSTNDEIFTRLKKEISENDSPNLQILLRWQG